MSRVNTQLTCSLFFFFRNPTQEEEFIWKPATKENKEILVIGDEFQMVNNLYNDKVKFWDDFLAKYKSLAVDGVVKDNNRDEL